MRIDWYQYIGMDRLIKVDRDEQTDTKRQTFAGIDRHEQTDINKQR